MPGRTSYDRDIRLTARHQAPARWSPKPTGPLLTPQRHQVHAAHHTRLYADYDNRHVSMWES